MCNWSEALIEQYQEEGLKKGLEEGIQTERTNAIRRMIQAGATKEQIIS